MLLLLLLFTVAHVAPSCPENTKQKYQLWGKRRTPRRTSSYHICRTRHCSSSNWRSSAKVAAAVAAASTHVATVLCCVVLPLLLAGCERYCSEYDICFSRLSHCSQTQSTLVATPSFSLSLSLHIYLCFSLSFSFGLAQLCLIMR